MHNDARKCKKGVATIVCYYRRWFSRLRLAISHILAKCEISIKGYTKQTPHPLSRQQKGQRGEQLARIYLQSQGLKYLEANYRCKGGEIDLIFKDKETIVFVEVRSRYTGPFGSALGSVDQRKRKHLRIAASSYLHKHAQGMPSRFDIVGLEPDGRLYWVKHAFTLLHGRDHFMH